MYKKSKTLALLIVEFFLFILGIWALLQDVSFFLTKKETSAMIVKLEKLPLPAPYKVTLRYYNEYEHKYIITYVDEIDGRYGQTLSTKDQLNIFYKKSLPKVIYLVNYKYPNSGYVVLYMLFLLIMIVAIIFQFITLKNQHKNQPPHSCSSLTSEAAK